MAEKSELIANPAARTAALVLLVVPLVEILAMAHHPSVRAHEVTQVVAGLRASAGLSALVHGLLIALMYVLLLALTEFSVWRGLSRPLVRAALIVYGAGVLLMTGAALVSGFITPRIAFVVPAEPALIAQLASFAMLFNQALAHPAAVLMSAGIAAWSLDLLRAGTAARAVGVTGLLVGLGCAGAMLGGVLHLDVHGMSLVVLLQSAWTIAVGFLLWRGARPA